MPGFNLSWKEETGSSLALLRLHVIVMGQLQILLQNGSGTLNNYMGTCFLIYYMFITAPCAQCFPDVQPSRHMYMITMSKH